MAGTVGRCNDAIDDQTPCASDECTIHADQRWFNCAAYACHAKKFAQQFWRKTFTANGEVIDMAKNQVKQEAEDIEPWLGEEPAEFGEASNDAEMPVKSRMQMRHKIEELLESRRLQKQLGDYESFDVDDEGRKTRRLH